MSLARRMESEQHEVRSTTHRRRVIVAADGRGWYVRHEGCRQPRQHKPAGLVVRYLDGDGEESWFGNREDP